MLNVRHNMDLCQQAVVWEQTSKGGQYLSPLHGPQLSLFFFSLTPTSGIAGVRSASLPQCLLEASLLT